MKVIIALLESFLGILLYAILTSLFYSLKIDFFSFGINSNQFTFYEIFSLTFLTFFYILFNFKLLLLFLLFYLLQNVVLQNRTYKLQIKIIVFLLVFFILTLIFDSNFSSNNQTINRFLQSCISIFITIILVSKISEYVQSKLKDWNL